MNLIEVTNKKTSKLFIEVAEFIYKNDPNRIRTLDNELHNTFDPKKNPDFKEGEAVRWILINENKQLIGRIAAFYNQRKSKLNEIPVGGIGFFECVNNQEAANLLFDSGKNWLKAKGFEAMDGPINFGENDTNWGLLIKGFDQPTFGMQYHKPYYKELFENYGFQLYYNQLSFKRKLEDNFEFPRRFDVIAKRLLSRPGYNFKHAKMSKVREFVDDLVTIYNNAWANFRNDFIPMNPDDVYRTFKKAKPILDEELIWFAYHNEKPVAVFIALPDINQILRHLNGKLDLFGTLKFLYYRRKKEMSRIRAIIAGVDPNYRNTGIESVVFKKFFEVLNRKKFYKELELSWVGDFNPKMLAIYEALGASHSKTHATYRYLFDRNKKFERFMPEEAMKCKYI